MKVIPTNRQVLVSRCADPRVRGTKESGGKIQVATYQPLQYGVVEAVDPARNPEIPMVCKVNDIVFFSPAGANGILTDYEQGMFLVHESSILAVDQTPPVRLDGTPTIEEPTAPSTIVTTDSFPAPDSLRELNKLAGGRLVN